MAWMGKRPMWLVNIVVVRTTHTCSLSVGAGMKLKSAVDGSMWFSKAGWSGLRIMETRAMECADFVDQRPFWNWVMCPSMVGVAFAGKYRDTFVTVNPGNDLKFPFLTAWRNCDLTGNPTVQWIYSMSCV